LDEERGGFWLPLFYFYPKESTTEVCYKKHCGEKKNTPSTNIPRRKAMLKTTEAAIRMIADFDSVEGVWEVHCPLIRDYRVPLDPDEKSWKVGAEFRKWCHENGLRFRCVGDGNLDEEEGFFYVNGLEMA